MQTRWLNPPNDSSWKINLTVEDGRSMAMLSLIALNRWGLSEELENPLAPALETVLLEWLQQEQGQCQNVLWQRQTVEIGSGQENLKIQALPIPTDTSLELDAVVNHQGQLLGYLQQQLPVDVWLLQGESLDGDKYYYWDGFSQAIVLLSLYPNASLPTLPRTSLYLYQNLLKIEWLAAVGSQPFDHFARLRSLSLSRSRSRSLSLSRLRSLSRSRSRSLSLSRLRSRSRSRSLSQSALISKPLQQALAAIANYLENNYPTDVFLIALERFNYYHAAADWFQEQADNPDLMRRCGLRPGEPLPRELELFDERGLPLTTQHRDKLPKLLDWLNDDEAVLDFAQITDQQQRATLRPHLQQLRTQPWSPQAAVQAILTGWPEDRPIIEDYPQFAEAQMLAACEALLKKQREDE